MSENTNSVKLNRMNIGRLTIRDSKLSRADFDLCIWRNEFSDFPSLTIDKAESLDVVDCRIHSLYFERVAVGNDEFYGANGPVRIFGFERIPAETDSQNIGSGLIEIDGEEVRTAESVKP